jgi:signal transduction histidine kinase
MRPEVLENGRLPEALVSVAHEWSALHGVRAEVTVTGTPRPLCPDVELALFRTAQEALANVAKHAGANRAGVTLSYMDDLVTLDVRDDGVGFHVERARALAAVPPAELDGARGGFGLAAMRERIGRLSGTFEIESETGHGTAVSASVPTLEGTGAR